MGFVISLETRTELRPLEEAEAKLILARKIMDYLRSYFVPKALESWSIAPLESLDGKLVERVSRRGSDMESLISSAKAILESRPWEVDTLTFKIEGEWIIGKNRVGGYLTIHNKEWRSTYGDLESNIYPTVEFSDLASLVKTDKEAETRLVSDFLRDFPTKVYRETPKVNRIYFGFGVPSRIDVDSLVAVYYSSDVAFIKDCLYTTKEEEGPKIKESFEPYKENFIVNGLKQVPAFQEYLDGLLSKHNVSKEIVGSMTLHAEGKDSFKTLFDEISNEIIKPLAEGLPDKDAILDRIRVALVEKTTRQAKLDFGNRRRDRTDES